MKLARPRNSETLVLHLAARWRTNIKGALNEESFHYASRLKLRRSALFRRSFLPCFSPLLPSVCYLSPCRPPTPPPLRFHIARLARQRGRRLMLLRRRSWKRSPCFRARSREGRVVDAEGIPFQSKKVPRGGTCDQRCWYSVCRVFEIPWGVVATYTPAPRHVGHAFFKRTSPTSFPIRYKPPLDRYDLIKGRISSCERSTPVPNLK